MKSKVIVTSVAVLTTQLLFAMYDCTIDSDVGTCDFHLCWEFCICAERKMCDHICSRHGLSFACLTFFRDNPAIAKTWSKQYWGWNFVEKN